jgi:tetratricopeptide (TPR) repeat protein
MGQLEEALTALERALKYNPKLWWVLDPLAVVYANLGRNEEALNTLNQFPKFFAKKGLDRLDLKYWMYWHPFKDKEIERNYANGLIKAGFPGKPGGYYKIYPENRLTGDKIKDLVFAHTITGFDMYSGNQWRIERAQDGESTYHGPKGWVKGEASEAEDTSDTGKSWIKGDRLCNQWDNLYGGFADCLTIYSNPEGAPENKDDYIGVSVYGFVPFSVVD